MNLWVRYEFSIWLKANYLDIGRILAKFSSILGLWPISFNLWVVFLGGILSRFLGVLTELGWLLEQNFVESVKFRLLVQLLTLLPQNVDQLSVLKPGWWWIFNLLFWAKVGRNSRTWWSSKSSGRSLSSCIALCSGGQHLWLPKKLISCVLRLLLTLKKSNSANFLAYSRLQNFNRRSLY